MNLAIIKDTKKEYKKFERLKLFQHLKIQKEKKNITHCISIRDLKLQNSYRLHLDLGSRYLLKVSHCVNYASQFIELRNVRNSGYLWTS